MATEGPQPLVITRIAGASLANSQFKAVKLDANGNVIDIAANTDTAIGILQNNPPSGGEAIIMCIGMSKYRANAAVAIGALLGVAADGEFETLAAGNPTRYWFGVSLDAPGGAAVIGTGLFNFVLPQAALTAN